jgi:RNA polymerase sigma-70 factor (ECF subfamily)
VDDATSLEKSGQTSPTLLQRVRALEPAAWERLAELYGPLIYSWCRRYGLQAPDAADVFQEVFSAVAAAIDRFEHGASGSTFRGWLWTITRNKICDFYRRRQNEVGGVGGTAAQIQLMEIPDELMDSNGDVSSHSAMSSLMHRGLEMVRAQFEPRTWEAFWRVAVEGQTTADVAADMGITANGVRQAKSRVLRRLRAELGDPP